MYPWMQDQGFMQWLSDGNAEDYGLPSTNLNVQKMKPTDLGKIDAAYQDYKKGQGGQDEAEAAQGQMSPQEQQQLQGGGQSMPNGAPNGGQSSFIHMQGQQPPQQQNINPDFMQQFVQSQMQPSGAPPMNASMPEEAPQLKKKSPPAKVRRSQRSNNSKQH